MYKKVHIILKSGLPLEILKLQRRKKRQAHLFNNNKLLKLNVELQN